MSLRAVSLVIALAACSSGSMKTHKGEPQTAREKMLAEEKEHPDEGDPTGATGKKWGRWRFQGERKDCFFLVGGKCFKTENAACQAARCKAPTRCTSDGAGPATIKCTKEAKE
jgi:hypothetical protein